MKRFDHSDEIQKFWREARTELSIEAQHFHATTLSDPEISTSVDRLAALVSDGRKAATSHLTLEFTRNGIPARKVGDLWIIADSWGRHACMVEVTRIEVRPFALVDAETAKAEGGGDLSLQYWQDVHRAYFETQCSRWGVPWSEELPRRH